MEKKDLGLFVADWLIPRGFLNLINRFKKRFIKSDRKIQAELLKNSKYSQFHKGKRCFIIGNGSSLKKQDLSFLSAEITFVMNAFWKHSIISDKWQPTYYCFADPITFDGSSVWKDFFDSLRKKINKSKYFVPILCKEVIKKQNLLPDDKTYFVLFDDDSKLNNDIDMTSGVPSVQSTSQLALEIAIYMGCNPIYLLGMDHDWLAHRGMDRHFYSDETIKGHTGVITDLSKTTYKSELEACLRLWNRYEYLKELATRQGIKILNATGGGFLDVFKRLRFEDVVGE